MQEQNKNEVKLSRIPESYHDNVNHPQHYTSGKYECIEVMEDIFGKETVMDFCVCNAFKYIFRHRKKNGIEDIEKAMWYLEKYIKLKGDGDDALWS